MGRHIVRVYIVDDERPAVLRLKDLLQNQPGIEVVGWATDVPVAIREIIRFKPELLFLDVEIKNQTGFDILKGVKDQGLNPGIIFVTAFSHYTIDAIRRQAFDYILKPISLPALLDALKRFRAKYDGIESDKLPACLTHREQEVLGLLLRGKSSQEIADELYITLNTVNTHRQHILDKLDAKSTSELLVRY